MPSPKAVSRALLLGLGLVSAQQRAQADNRRPKVILDNDWTATEFLPVLQALHAGWDVVGLASNTANAWAKQTALQAVAALELGNLTRCIPVYRGADYPLLNRPGLARAWGEIHGPLPFEGAFARRGRHDDPEAVDEATFVAGLPRTSYVADVGAAEFLVRTVREHPGDVAVFSAGALTNVALAHSIDRTFARNTRGLFVMGGYVDVNLLEAAGGVHQADLQSDINLKMDAEAAKIALSAPFPSITLVGNAANQYIPTEAYLTELAEADNAYTRLLYEHLNRHHPLWDATAAAVMLDPAVVVNSTEVYVDVDTSRDSPAYGTIRVYQEALRPRAQTLQKVRMVMTVDEERLGAQIRGALQSPRTCADLGGFV